MAHRPAPMTGAQDVPVRLRPPDARRYLQLVLAGLWLLDAVLHGALIDRELGAALDLPFTPLEPPELRARCAALSRRLGEAAGSADSAAADLLPAEEPDSQHRAAQRPGGEHQ